MNKEQMPLTREALEFLWDKMERWRCFYLVEDGDVAILRQDLEDLIDICIKETKEETK